MGSIVARVNVDGDGLRATVEEMLRELRVTTVPVESARGILITDSSDVLQREASPAVLLWGSDRLRGELFDFSGLRHLLSTSPHVDIDHLRSTLQQIDEQRHLQLDDVLKTPYMSEVAEVSSSGRKGVLIARFTQFLQGAGIRERLHDHLISYVEEMFTNAVYNAPLRDGRRLYAATHRTKLVRSERPVTLKWAFDRTNICVVVRDEYGSLSAEKLLQTLGRCYAGPQASPEDKEGGAGLGFFTLMRFCSRLVVNLEPGKATEVIAIRRVADRRRVWPSLNICLT